MTKLGLIKFKSIANNIHIAHARILLGTIAILFIMFSILDCIIFLFMNVLYLVLSNQLFP